MATGSELASAWVTIYPKFARNFNSTITKQVSSAVSSATKGIGSTGASIGRSLGRNIQSGLSTTKIAIGNVIASGITSAVGAATSAITSTVGDAIERADILNNFPKMMEQWGTSAEDAEASVKKLRAGVEGLPTTTASMVQATQRLYTMLGDVSKASDAALGLNDMLLSNGASGALYENAFEQFSQMLAAGKVDMMAWRSVVNAAPKSVDTLAKSLLGATATANDLYDALPGSAYAKNHGAKLEVTDLVDAIIELDKTGADGMAGFSEQAHNASKGIATSLKNIRNAVTNVQTDIIDKLGRDKIAGELDKLKAKIYDFGNWFVSAPYFDKIKAKLDEFDFNEAFDKLKSQFSKTISWLQTNVVPPVRRVFDSLKGVIQSTVSAVSRNAEAFSSLFSSVLDFAAGLIERSAPMMGQGIGKLIDKMGQLTFDKLKSRLSKTISWLQYNVVPPVRRVFDSLKGVIQSAVSAVSRNAEAFSGLFSRVLDFAAGLIERSAPMMEQGIGKLIDKMGQLAAWLNQRFDDGTIAGVLTSIWDKLKQVSEWIHNDLMPTIGRVWDVFQPVLERIKGEFASIGDGDALGGFLSIITGAAERLGTVLGDVFGFVDAHWQDIMSLLGTLGEVARKALDGIWQFISEHSEQIWQFFENLLDLALSAFDGIATFIDQHGDQLYAFFEKLLDAFVNISSFAADNIDWLGPMLIGWLATTKLLIPTITGIGTAVKGVKASIGKGKAGVDWIKNIFKAGAAEGTAGQAAAAASEELVPLSKMVAAVNEQAIADTAATATTAVSNTAAVTEAGISSIDDVARIGAETFAAAEGSAAGVASSAGATAAGMESAAKSAGTLGEALAGLVEKFPFLKVLGKAGKFAGPIGWGLTAADMGLEIWQGSVQPHIDAANNQAWANPVIEQAMDELLKRSKTGDPNDLDMVDAMRWNQLVYYAEGGVEKTRISQEELLGELRNMKFEVSMDGKRVAYMRASDNSDASGDFQLGAQRGWAGSY